MWRPRAKQRRAAHHSFGSGGGIQAQPRRFKVVRWYLATGAASGRKRRSCDPKRTLGCATGGRWRARQAPRSHQRSSDRRVSAPLANLGPLSREWSKLGSSLRAASRSDPDGDISPSRSAAPSGVSGRRGDCCSAACCGTVAASGFCSDFPLLRLAVGRGYAVRVAVFGPPHSAQVAVQCLRALRPRGSAFGRPPTASHRRGLRRRASNALRLRALRSGHTRCAFHGHAPSGASSSGSRADQITPAHVSPKAHGSIEQPEVATPLVRNGLLWRSKALRSRARWNQSAERGNT